MSTTLHSFIDIFDSEFETDGTPVKIKKIVIPIIQRDYAQGRENPDVNRMRTRFLSSLHDAIDKQHPITLDFVYNYMLSGGDVTLKALRKLQNESPETLCNIIGYLKEAPLYEIVTAGGKNFLLCHSGLDNFSPERSPADYTADELIWAWPELTDRYFDDCITVFGHTPTKSYGEKYNGKILKTDTWIDVDVGVPYGNNPCLLRLDDLKEFYL